MPRPSRARSSQVSAPAPDPLEAALDELALRDRRPTYRALLKKLKARNAAAYEAAVAYHEEKLKPQAAAAGELVEEWIEYGRYIAELCAPGRTVLIDPTGLAEPYRRPIPPQRLVLHLPEGRAEPGVVLLAPEAAPQGQTRCGVPPPRPKVSRQAPNTVQAPVPKGFSARITTHGERQALRGVGKSRIESCARREKEGCGWDPAAAFSFGTGLSCPPVPPTYAAAP